MYHIPLILVSLIWGPGDMFAGGERMLGVSRV